MGQYNEDLVKAGILLAGEGLHPSSKGARVSSPAQIAVSWMPFTETKELIAGFWIWQVVEEESDRLGETFAPTHARESEVRNPSCFTGDDFGEELPELSAKHAFKQ